MGKSQYTWKGRIWLIITKFFAIIPIPFFLIRLKALLLFHTLLQRKNAKKSMKQLLILSDDVEGVLNQIAFRYDDNEVHVKHRLMKYHDFFVSRIKKSDVVFDVGCGYGALAYSIAVKSGAKVLGIDINQSSLEKAKRKFSLENLSYLCADATKESKYGKCDVIVLSNVLEHIERRPEFLKALSKNNSPSKFLIRVPMLNRYWTVPMKKELGMLYYSDKTHFTEYSVPSFLEEMKMSNLEVEDLLTNWGEIWASLSVKS